MNAASSDQLSLGMRKEKNNIWLGTYFFDSIPYSIRNMNNSDVWKSQMVPFMYVNLLVEFKFIRLSFLEFIFSCNRNQTVPPGYTLRFHCSINIFPDSPKIFVMQSNQDIVFEEFHLNPLCLRHLSATEFNKNFEIKVSVNMIEYDCYPNIMQLHQEDKFYSVKMHLLKDEDVLADLGYILQNPRLKDIFTGRQVYNFCLAKCSFIENTAVFSSEIAHYLKAKEAGIFVPFIDLAIILNFLIKDIKAPINNFNLLRVYFYAHYLGLQYLVILSQDLILLRIENPTFVIDALMAADRVNDEILFDKVAKKFHYFERQMPDPKGWLERFKSKDVESRFTADSLKRRLE